MDGWRTDTPVAMFHVEHGHVSQTTPGSEE